MVQRAGLNKKEADESADLFFTFVQVGLDDF
jgi:hypothetical protein